MVHFKMNVTTRNLMATSMAALIFTLIPACNDTNDGTGAQPIPPITNLPPTVSAGVDQEATEGSRVTLSGTVTDPEDMPSVTWTQLDGIQVELLDPTSLTPAFDAPQVLEAEVLQFQLTADDGTNASVSDTVQVTVQDNGVTVDRLNPDGESYIDPEIHPLRGELVYQTFGEVWVGAVDLADGQFVSATGKDTFIGDTISLTESKNGPEYGLDSGGVAIFYNSTGSDGSLQFSRAAELGGGQYDVQQLTPDGIDRINQLASQDETSDTTYLVYARDANVPGVADATGYIAYLDENAPDDDQDVTAVRPGFAGFRWLRGSTQFTTTAAEDGPDEGQIKLVDAATGEERVITNDPGVKFDPYPWYAPEFDGAIAVQATVNQTDIAIYVDRGTELFERVALLSPPNSTILEYVQSAEPFVSSEGVSYISLTLKDNPGSIFTDVSESEIWIYGIEDGADRFTLKCGDDILGKVRHEAEMVSGENQVLVYYNEFQPSGVIDLIVCQSGIAP